MKKTAFDPPFPAPNFDLAVLDGEKATLEDYKGQFALTAIPVRSRARQANTVGPLRSHPCAQKLGAPDSEASREIWVGRVSE